MGPQERPPPGSRVRVRVSILDDHQLFAEALEIALVLEGYDARRVPLPGAGASLATIDSAIAGQRPQLALLDLDLGRLGSSLPLITPLTRAGISVVVITGVIEEVSWGQCYQLGASAVLLKTQPLKEILTAIAKVRLGRVVTPPAERTRLIRQWRARQVELSALRRRLALLTPREREVLGDLTQGHTVHEIALLGNVSEATVRSQVKSILAKLEVSSQIAAVGIAHRVGWIAPDA